VATRGKNMTVDGGMRIRWTKRGTGRREKARKGILLRGHTILRGGKRRGRECKWGDKKRRKVEKSQW